MKAIIMAGGQGTRLGLLTNGSLNKHMLPVYDRPMITYPLESLVRGGITDIRISLNFSTPQLLMELLEDGAQFGCTLHYTYHRRAFAGPARHFILYEEWAAGDDVVVMLGDSLFTFPLDFRTVKPPHIWTMPLDGVDDPSKYGQVEVDGDLVIKLVEKPKLVFSNRIATGCWVFPNDVFAIARRLSEKNGELQFGDLALEYVRQGRMTHTPMPPSSYLDLGTHDALLTATQMIAAQRKASAAATK